MALDDRLTCSPARDFRIGSEDDLPSSHSTATDLRDRVALIDTALDQVQTVGGVLILELDHEGDGFTKIDQFRIAGAPVGSILISFLRVGVLNGYAAAEHQRWQFPAGKDFEVITTVNLVADRHAPRVPYDAHRNAHFPPETVVPLTRVRQLMIDYAHTGTWSPHVPWQRHHDLVA